MNTNNFVAINTPYGQTERVNMKNIVMQGSKWGPLKCSNSIDKIGKRCIARNEHLYLYKGEVKVMPLAMIDDLLVVSECGRKSVNSNIYVNSEISNKKLRLHTPVAGSKSKCHVIHIGRIKELCQTLKALASVHFISKLP